MQTSQWMKKKEKRKQNRINTKDYNLTCNCVSQDNTRRFALGSLFKGI